MNEQTMRNLLEKWSYRMMVASNNGGASISEPEAEELLYLLKTLEAQFAPPR